jgi:hemerythrin-like domain-containing protein
MTEVKKLEEVMEVLHKSMNSTEKLIWNSDDNVFPKHDVEVDDVKSLVEFIKNKLDEVV